MFFLGTPAAHCWPAFAATIRLPQSTLKSHEQEMPRLPQQERPPIPDTGAGCNLAEALSLALRVPRLHAAVSRDQPKNLSGCGGDPGDHCGGRHRDIPVGSDPGPGQLIRQKAPTLGRWPAGTRAGSRRTSARHSCQRYSDHTTRSRRVTESEAAFANPGKLTSAAFCASRCPWPRRRTP